MVVKIRAKSQITLPSKTIKSLGINEGDEYEVVERDDGSILLVPVVTYPKAYVDKLEKEVNAETREAMMRVENGKDLVGPFKTVEEAMDYLNA